MSAARAGAGDASPTGSAWMKGLAMRARGEDARFGMASIAGGILPILFAPILSRVYTPGELGPYNAYAILAAAVGAIGTARVEALVVVARSSRRMVQLALAAALILVATILVATLPWFVPGMNLGAFDEARLRWLLPIGAALIGMDAIGSAILARSGTILPIGTARLAQGTARPLVQVVLSGWRSGLGLYAGAIAAQVASLLVMLKAIAAEGSQIHRGSTAAAVRAIRHFSKYIGTGLVAAAVNTFAVYAMLLMLAVVLAPHTYGLVAMTAALLGIPVTLLIPAMRQIIIRDVGKVVRAGGAPNQLTAGLRRYLWTCLPLTLVGIAVAWVLGPMLVVPVLGAQWAEAAPFVRPLAVAAGAQLIVSPLGLLLPLVGAVGRQLWVDVWRVGCTAAWVGYAHRTGASSGTIVIGCAVATVLGYAVMLVVVSRTLSRGKE